MYHSKVVLICWGVVYLSAIVAAVLKKRWDGLRTVVIGAAIVAAGIGFSAVLNNPVGGVFLSIALLVAAYITLKGIILIFTQNSLQ